MAQLLKNLPIGAKVKFGKYSVNGESAQSIVWVIAAQNHSSTPAYPSNSTTLLTEKIIDIRPLDAAEPNNTDVDSVQRSIYGNNRYSLSNLDQWLNKDSGAGLWYSAQHSLDQAPTGNTVVLNGTGYATRPGFLNAFSEFEKNAIQTTTIRVAKSYVDGGGYEDIPRKVFLPSMSERGGKLDNGVEEGNKWSYFDTYSPVAYLTQQAIDFSPYSSKHNDTWAWWLRTPNPQSVYETYHIGAGGMFGDEAVYWGNFGVRPALNVLSTQVVSDITDSDGCYTFIWNTAPSVPPTLTPPSNIYGGKLNSISWGFALDPDGDSLTYQLECSMNGGAYTVIYNGTSTIYTHLVPYGTTSVTYKVKAIDSSGASSDYIISDTKTVINNHAPVISGTDTDFGVQEGVFWGTYTITDADKDTVVVTEALDGVPMRSFVADLGSEKLYSVDGTNWLTLPNGIHTLTISATDGIDTTIRTYTFTKLVNQLSIQNSTPWAASTMPTRIMLVVTRNIPSGATFKVLVCNNGYDSSPTWEDCTNAVKSGMVHVFTNTTKTASDWGVRFWVSVSRENARGACYVSAIGGNFE